MMQVSVRVPSRLRNRVGENLWYSFTEWGFILTLLGTFLAALKTVLTSILQTPLTSSRLTSTLPVARPVTAKPGYEYILPPSPIPGTKTLPNVQYGNYNNLPTSPYLSALATRAPPVPPSSPTPLFNLPLLRFDLDFGLSYQNVVSTSIKLHPSDLLMRMSPLAFVQCIGYAWASGELERAMVHKGPGLEGWSQKSATVLLLNGIIAFLLNIVSLTASQKNGPSTMTVAVLTVLLAMYMFHSTITPANSIGIALTLAGGAWYGALEYGEKKNRLRMV
ncbi:UAA transporter [Tulasnella sp. 424]|nr:UAA transporter [Tulasnella sp. 424]